MDVHLVEIVPYSAQTLRALRHGSRNQLDKPAATMATLPIDLLHDVARYLDTEDLMSISAVSKAWREVLLSSRQLWQHPRFKLILDEQGKPRKYSPRPGFITTRLQGLSLRSLHFSGPSVLLPLARPLPFTSQIILNSITLELLNRLPIPARDPKFHLIIDELPVKMLVGFILLLVARLPATSLTIGVLPNFVDHASVVECIDSKLLPSLSPIYPLDSIEVASAIGESSVFHTVLATRPSTSLDHIPGLDPPVIKGLSCMIPESCHGTWKPWDLRYLPLLRSPYTHIQGGAWKFPRVWLSAVTRELVCKDLWKLQCTSDSLSLHKLESLHLSFRPNGTTNWGDIARFMLSTMGPELRVLDLSFPVENENGVQHDSVNAAWAERIARLYNLREISLTNYIPSDLSALCQERDVCGHIQKLVLAGDILPRDFLKVFTPDKLPRLRVFGLSEAVWNRRTNLQEREMWIQGWRLASIEELLSHLVSLLRDLDDDNEQQSNWHMQRRRRKAVRKQGV